MLSTITCSVLVFEELGYEEEDKVIKGCDLHICLHVSQGISPSSYAKYSQKVVKPSPENSANLLVNTWYNNWLASRVLAEAQKWTGYL